MKKNLLNVDLTDMGDEGIEISDAVLNGENQPVEVNTEEQEQQEVVNEQTTTEVVQEEDDGAIEVPDTLFGNTVEEDGTNNNGFIEVDEDNIDNTETDDVREDAGNSDSPSQMQEPLRIFAQQLNEQGILPNLNIEQFDGSEEGLMNAVYDEIKTGVDSYKDSLPPAIKTIIDNYEEGVPLKTLLDVDESISNYSSITEEKLESDLELQRKIVKEHLKKSTSFSDTKINSLIDKFDTIGTLEEEAKEALPELRKFDELEIQKEKERIAVQQKEIQEQQTKVIKELNEKVTATEEIVPGIKLNKASKTKLLESLTKPVGVDVNGQPISKVAQIRNEDPIGFEIALHYLVDVTNGFKDFSKLHSGTKKKVMSDLEKATQGIVTNSTVKTNKPNNTGGSSNRLKNALNFHSKKY